MHLRLFTNTSDKKVIDLIGVLCDFYEPYVGFEGQIDLPQPPNNKIIYPAEKDKGNLRYILGIDKRIKQLGNAKLIMTVDEIIDKQPFIKSVIPLQGVNTYYSIYLSDCCFFNPINAQITLFEEFDESVLKKPHQKINHSTKEKVDCCHTSPYKLIDSGLTHQKLLDEVVRTFYPFPCKNHKSQVINAIIENYKTIS